MNSASISFVSEVFPERNLEKTTIVRYYPNTVMKEQILTDVKQHLKCDLEKYIVEVRVEVILKQYKINNDTKNT